MSLDWAAIYNDTYEDLVRFLHRQVWDSDRAQDLAQEVFVRVLDQEPENPRAFVFTVAVNLARDEARTAVRRKKHLTLLKNETELRQEMTPGLDDELDVSHRHDSVRRALAELNERDRETLLLWDAGLNYTEIAGQSGLSLRSVGTTLARARKRLVEAYDSLEAKSVARR